MREDAFLGDYNLERLEPNLESAVENFNELRCDRWPGTQAANFTITNTVAAFFAVLSVGNSNQAEFQAGKYYHVGSPSDDLRILTTLIREKLLN